MADFNIEELKAKTSEALAMNRQWLLMKYPFVGGILMQLNIYPVRDKRVRTAMTDGRNVYVDVDFYSTLTEDERRFILAHEAWHCIFMHMVRLQNRDRMLFNYATDMEINRVLTNDNLKAPANVLFPEHGMEEMSAEQIYEVLLKKLKKNKKQQSSLGMPSSGNGSRKDDNKSDDDTDDNADNSNRSKSDDKNNKPNNQTKSKRSSGKGKQLSGQFDDHCYKGDDNGDGEDDNRDEVTDQWGKVGYDPDFKPCVSDDTAERIREMVIAEAERASRTAGGMPAGLEGYLEKLRAPEISWKEVLAQFVTSCYNGKRRWLPPSRRHVYNEIYLQSRRDEKIRIVVAVDTSGSCVGDLPKFFGELTGLLNSFGNYEMTLIQNDYTISSVEKYDQSNPFPDDVKDIKWIGGGGTSFAAPFNWVKENMPEIDCFIFFTDGYECFCDENEREISYSQPPYPVLWILTKDGNTDFCDWGQKIYFEHDTYDTEFADNFNN